MDEALALPGAEAVTVALRTQQIIAHESGVTNTVDPLGGSYFVEALTDEMERQARAYFRRVDEYGGLLPALEEGFFQREITEAAVRFQREVESRRRIIVGVNDYVSGDQQRCRCWKWTWPAISANWIVCTPCAVPVTSEPC